MKNKVIQFVKTYLLFILIFLVQKPLFMFYYHDIYGNATFVDYLLVMWNGLKLDASMAGYLTVIPGFILILSLWLKLPLIQLIQKVYFYIIAFALSLISIADLGLYRYWGFRLDSSPLFYLSSPKSAFASADWWLIVAGLLLVILSVALLCFLFNNILIGTKKAKLPFHPIPTAGCLLLLTALLFIPIRGGFTVSTMNTGKVYFSPRMELNHAAINPCFSLMESLSREQNFADQYRFMDADVALEEFNQLTDKPATDSIPSLFTTKRPNVIFVILESFMSKVIEPLGGLPDVARRLNGFSQEGVLFTNFYANSFRTDRGLVSIIGGYPAQPTTSIMKYPRKTQHLPSIPASLKKAGYELQYYYGGDADFTNMRSYLMACGIENIISDVDFPLKERQSKWGALDETVFSRLTNDLKLQQKEPFMKILQTSSSHEPFEVPYHRLSDLYLNSVAYTDSCLGNFIDQFKQTKYWDNTVIVFVPDHATRYPIDLDNRDVARYRIPLLMIGGAVKQPLKVDTYASQIDIAATLLHQLQLPHDEFRFSKNILNPASPHFAYFT
ncbi:MAG: sulfatase-like hydrolase/transferase, partial [Bacteroidaceae bacterium]